MPLFMLLVLMLPWVIVTSIPRLRRNWIARRIAAVLGLALLFGFMASGHMAHGRPALVRVTGELEILVAFGLLWGRTRRFSAVGAVILLVAFFPYIVDAPEGVGYLLVYTLVQAAAITWTWCFLLRTDAGVRAPSLRSYAQPEEVPRRVLLQNTVD
jgi:hypothetical protein